jgi:hypothetical protein
MSEMTCDACGVGLTTWSARFGESIEPNSVIPYLGEASKAFVNANYA